MKKLAICAIASNENLYLRDWVKYHMELGVSKIILFDNSPVNGDFPQQVVGDYITDRSVEVVLVRKDGFNPPFLQEMCYTAAYEIYHKNFDYMAFIDVDEYLTLSPSLSLDGFLGRFDDSDLIKLNWMCYTDNGLLHYDDRSVIERFTEPMKPYNKPDWWSDKHPVNSTIKTIVNCNNAEYASFIATKTPHICETNKKANAVAKTANGKPVNPYASACNIDYSVAWLRHFRTLTIEEFLYRRFARGMGDSRAVTTKVKDLLKIFTVENRPTPEKQQIVNDFFLNGPGRVHLEYEAEHPEDVGEENFEFNEEYYNNLLEKVSQSHK